MPLIPARELFTLGGDAKAAVNVDGNGSSFVAGANYVKFTDITLTSMGSISFTYAGGPRIGGEGNFNGLQLEAIPEPSTCALIGLAAIGSVLRVRRRQPNTAG